MVHDEEAFEGGNNEKSMIDKMKINQEKLDYYLAQENIFFRNGNYYKESMIEDKGFNKWRQAFDQTAKIIKWVSLFISFKFYRMTYSFFMGNKNFLVIY